MIPASVFRSCGDVSRNVTIGNRKIERRNAKEVGSTYCNTVRDVWMVRFSSLILCQNTKVESGFSIVIHTGTTVLCEWAAYVRTDTGRMW